MWQSGWPDILRDLELFGEYPWGSWQAFEDAPEWVKDRAWDWTQEKRRAEHARLKPK